MAATSDGDRDDVVVLCIIGNIPGEFHSADLRNYFSQFIETGGFECFHFRHRPEARSQNDVKKSSDDAITSSATQPANNVEKTLCCVTKLNNSNADKLIKMYHGKQWVGKDGSSMARRCRISKVKVNQDSSSSRYKTRKEQKTIPSDRETFTETDLTNLIEMKPPSIMPNGNVGTPTKYFMDLIRACRMPPSMIKKLGLSFPRTRSNRRYGNVPFDYGGEFPYNDEQEPVLTATGDEIIAMKLQSIDESEIAIGNTTSEEYSPGKEQSVRTRKTGKLKRELDNLHRKVPLKMDDSDEGGEENESSDSDQDDDGCENWERHEALHNNVTEQERTKERLYEEEIELKWEKGGSGLVFYTDAYYWDQRAGDFDEKTADDWDVDMSAYYDPDGGDKDSRDYLQIRLEQRRRDGIPDDINRIGKFENHTKGIGRKIMEQQGWNDGDGLGCGSGITEALENDGQHPRHRKGLGYYGGKMSRNLDKTRKRRAEDGIITTIYDNPQETDQSDTLLRSQHPWTLKYRPDQLLRSHDQSDSLLRSHDQSDSLLRSPYPWKLNYRPDVKFIKGTDRDSS